MTNIANTLDHLLEGYQLIDHNWRYLYVNDSVVKQSKFSKKEELLGFTMMEKYPGIENSQMFKILQNVMLEGTSAHFENQFEFPDKTTGWFDLLMEAVPEGVFILSTDITERKKLEFEKQAYMQALEEMIHMTSHEVRQPVANCLGLMNMLSEQDPTKEDLLKIVGHVRESASRLDKFTKKLTDFMVELQSRKKSFSSSN